jgi:hypothetical protein
VIHDDILHTGSAKRATVNGVASLDAAGKVPVAEVGAVELTTNKDAASGYPGLDASSLIALAQQRVLFKVGSFTRDTSTATGTQAITGVGFVPRLVLFFASDTSNAHSVSIGVDEGTVPQCLTDYNASSANTWAQITNAIRLIQAAGIDYRGNIQSMDADGFTISWTKVGAKTGAATISYIAIR